MTTLNIVYFIAGALFGVVSNGMVILFLMSRDYRRERAKSPIHANYKVEIPK